MKDILKRILSDDQIKGIYRIIEKLLLFSLKKAAREQGLTEISTNLAKVVPDLTEQYDTFKIDNEYLENKVRFMHAFQYSMIEKAVSALDIKERSTIIDIGDSSGTHIQYITSLLGNYDTISVDLNPNAIAKVKQKGLKGICAKAEDIEQYGINADLYLSFEMLEHLRSPIDFLKSLSTSSCKGFVISVPFVDKSRVSLNYIKRGKEHKVYAENTHIFELSKSDWSLLFMLSGWRIVFDKVYYQYPKNSIFRFFKLFWKRFDFEGFWSAVLVRDSKWSELYQSW